MTNLINYFILDCAYYDYLSSFSFSSQFQWKLSLFCLFLKFNWVIYNSFCFLGNYYVDDLNKSLDLSTGKRVKYIFNSQKEEFSETVNINFIVV